MTGPDLCKERESQGLTLREVAPHLGLTHQRLARIEAQPYPTAEMQERVLAGIYKALAFRRDQALAAGAPQEAPQP